MSAFENAYYIYNDNRICIPLSKFITQNRSKMNFKKLAGDLLVVAGGVALYMLAIKPLLDKAKITS